MFALLGCQEQETGPVISTVYIEEIDMLRDSAPIVPKTEIIKNIEIKEASIYSFPLIDNATEPVEKKATICILSFMYGKL